MQGFVGKVVLQILRGVEKLILILKDEGDSSQSLAQFL